MKTYIVKRAAAASLALSAWLLMPQIAQCFYNPSTGRWLSRDPAEEESFRTGRLSDIAEQPVLSILLATNAPNHAYAFINNHPVGSVDLLGLAGCCGPDVTAVLSQTLTEIEKTYRSWHIGKKFVACMYLVNLPWAASSWDINKLYELGSDPNGFNFMPPARQGSGNCNQTVAYKSKCYNSSGVNYIQYGKVNSLCNGTFPAKVPIPRLKVAYWGLSLTLARVAAWKVVRYKGAMLPEALDFTTAGYLGCGPMRAGRRDCIVDPANVAGDKFLVWQWHPYEP